MRERFARRQPLPSQAIRPIGESPVHLPEIDSRGVRLVARPGLEFEVERLSDDLLAARIENLGIMVFGSNRQALCDSLEEAIAEVWTHYMAGDAALPTAKASTMRCELIARFRLY